MSEEIVRRLRELHEKSPIQFDKDEDEEKEDDEEELEYDDSQNPSISPEEAPPKKSAPHKNLDKLAAEDEEDEYVEKEEKPKPTSHKKSINPLDNTYAVQFKLGDEITLDTSDNSKREFKGVIEGYDKEGFYRVKWEDGATTNGFTDASLTEFVDSIEENSCICGGDVFLHEGSKLVCDRCGRVIKEYKNSNNPESEWYKLKNSYDRYKKYKDREKESGDIRDLTDDLDAKGVSYEIYRDSSDEGCTVFYDTTPKKMKETARILSEKDKNFKKSIIRAMQKPISTMKKPNIADAVPESADI